MQQLGQIDGPSHQPRLRHDSEFTWEKYCSKRGRKHALQLSVALPRYCRQQRLPNVDGVSLEAQFKNIDSILHRSTSNISDRRCFCVGTSNQKTLLVLVQPFWLLAPILRRANGCTSSFGICSLVQAHDRWQITMLERCNSHSV